MKITIDLFVHKDSQIASAWVRQVGENSPNIIQLWEGYDGYTFTVEVPHITEYKKIESKEVLDANRTQ
jgi:hypothetical protein